MRLKTLLCCLLFIIIFDKAESRENNAQALKDVPTYFVCGTNDGLLKLGDRIAETKMVVIH